LTGRAPRSHNRGPMATPAELAQHQLDTFNDHDLDGFLPVFAEDVVIVNLADGTEILRGIDAFRERYAAAFRDRPGVHAELVGRLVMDRYVVDQERVSDGDDDPAGDALAIYEVEDGLIVRMWFLVPGGPVLA